MAPECWFCGEPIRRTDPAEALPGGAVAVHARCVRRDADGRSTVTVKQAA
jgi:hypothetical protein